MSEPSHMFQLEFPSPSVADSEGRGPVLLHALEGFSDAGHALKLFSEAIRSDLEPELVASFNVDELIDYRSRRPMMTFRDNRFVAADVPELKLYAVRDKLGTPFLLLAGAEPDLRWEAFTQALSVLSDRFAVRTVIGLNAIPMAVPHTRPLAITGHGNNDELLAGVRTWDSTMKIPGSASHLLELRLGDAGLDTVGLSVHVPHYLAQNDYPDAAVRLMEEVGQMSGLVLPTAELTESGRAVRTSIDAQVADSEEVQSVVAHLERQYDSFLEAESRPQLLVGDGENIPSGDELGAELEKFLAEQAESDNSGDDI